MKFRLFIIILVTPLLFFGSNVFGYPDVFIDFEDLFDYTPVTDQYASDYVTFAGATVLTAGISLNEFDFPPNSGVNVVFNEYEAIDMYFSDAVYNWSAYFTYVSPVDITYYGACGTQLGTISSDYFENYASSGNSPNEFLSIIAPEGIRSIHIAGDPYGGSFVMDDVAYSVIAEPISISLLGLGLIAIAIHRKIKR